MLLKLGATMMAAALAIAAGVTLTVLLRTPETPAATSPARVSGETEAPLDNDLDSYEKFSQAKPEPKSRSKLRSEPEPAPELAVEPAPRSAAEPEPLQSALVAGEEGFPVPEEDELARLDEPRRFAPDPGADLTLSLPSLGVRNAPVYDSDSSRALEAGVGQVPET